METVVAIETWGIPEAYAKGYYPGGSLYSKQTGDSCCLGFSAIQAGITPDQADGLAYPHCVTQPGLDSPPRLPPEQFPSALKIFGNGPNSTPLAQIAASINDNEEIGWRAKVDLLTTVFSVHGEELTFTFEGNTVYKHLLAQHKTIDMFLKRKREKHARKLRRAGAAFERIESERYF